ncbi:MAG: DNA-binding protein [Desulfurococcales archaeon]|nr:DNA-binding protein [Desulfurococcales archaeon]MCE4605057.1 DNA-binding protein [Desulfurococcales archaeon]
MIEDIYLMSIRPKYARAIFAGRKKYELRKLSGAPSIEEGSIVIVYASGQIKGIIGEFRVGRVIKAAPEKVWEIVRQPGTGIGEDAWFYIRGARQAMALEVRDPTPYQRPVTLEEIRRVIPGWMPPFSYKPLREGDPVYELVIRRIRSTLRGS